MQSSDSAGKFPVSVALLKLVLVEDSHHHKLYSSTGYALHLDRHNSNLLALASLALLITKTMSPQLFLSDTYG